MGNIHFASEDFNTNISSVPIYFRLTVVLLGNKSIHISMYRIKIHFASEDFNTKISVVSIYFKLTWGSTW